MLFNKLHAKLTLTEGSRPKHLEDRVAKLEHDVRDLRSALRELVELLEREFGKDLDQDGTVGTVSPKRGLPRMARLRTPGSRPKR